MIERLALNQGTLKQLSLDQALGVAKEANYSAFSVWSECFMKYVNSGHSLSEACDLVCGSGLDIAELTFQKEWLFVTGAKKIQSLKEIDEICTIAQAINAECICAPAYGYEGDMEQAVQNFKDFCDIAAKHKQRVAMEFVPTFKIHNLSLAREIIERANKDNGGIVVDAFHVFKGSTQLADFETIPVDKIYIVHMCDLPNISDQDVDIVTQARKYRVYPGEGDFDLVIFCQKLKQLNYHGRFSIEILSDELVRNDPLDVAKQAMASTLKLLEQVYENTEGEGL